jgi:hypothetical protein
MKAGHCSAESDFSGDMFAVLLHGSRADKHSAAIWPTGPAFAEIFHDAFLAGVRPGVRARRSCSALRMKGAADSVTRARPASKSRTNSTTVLSLSFASKMERRHQPWWEIPVRDQS